MTIQTHDVLSGDPKGLQPVVTPPPTALKYEQLVAWAVNEWQRRWPDQPYHIVWASTTCAHKIALKRLKVGRKLRTKFSYAGYQSLWCPHVVPISDFNTPYRKTQLTESAGAYLFSFKRGAQQFPVLYVSAIRAEDDCGNSKSAVALVAVEALDAWDDFETKCGIAAYHLERSQKVYVVGGMDQSFKPNVDWDDVILPEALKKDLRTELETFFAEGVSIYKQVNLVPFRKLLLVGAPGTGKSMLCAALAKLAIAMKCVVIYVSSADEDGASFDKVQQALRRVARSHQPTLLIIEELDAYLKDEDKAQILNVLDGFEAPNNPRGALMIATTNYPEKIDERIAKRPGRVDRVIRIPLIEDAAQGVLLLKRYLGKLWREEHAEVATQLVGQTGAFVREMVVYARMLVINRRGADVTLDVLRESLKSLTTQVEANIAMEPRRPIGFSGQPVPAPYLNRSGQ